MQRFYGGDPERWFHLPIPLLHAYIAMQERIQAEESLHHIHLATLSSPYCNADYRNRVLGQWEALVHGARDGHDGEGRLLIRSGKQLRQWMSTVGGFTAEELI